MELCEEEGDVEDTEITDSCSDGENGHEEEM